VEVCRGGEGRASCLGLGPGGHDGELPVGASVRAAPDTLALLHRAGMPVPAAVLPGAVVQADAIVAVTIAPLGAWGANPPWSVRSA
jgi:hypothetical protein